MGLGIITDEEGWRWRDEERWVVRAQDMAEG